VGQRQSTLESMELNPDFWRDKKVLLTGHTGFKGSWLSLWLQRMGARVHGISLAPHTAPNLFSQLDAGTWSSHSVCDVRHADALAERVQAIQPQLVFHLAAHALVRASYREPRETFDTNVMGTVNVLEALRKVPSARVAVMVTTDKVYRNLEQMTPYREHDALGGHDPYSASKAASELAIASYRDSFLKANGVAVASARAGNVIGGGDWSEDRLIPDAVRAWQGEEPLRIRSPDSVRPWQHVLEPLHGYMRLAQSLWHQPQLADAYNFGSLVEEAAPVRTVIDHALRTYAQGRVEYAPQDAQAMHEAGLLTLDVSKARSVLDVAPRWHLAESVERTMRWYRDHRAGTSAQTLCLQDIAAFEGAA